MCKSCEISVLADKLKEKGIRLDEKTIKKNLCECNREFLEALDRIL